VALSGGTEEIVETLDHDSLPAPGFEPGTPKYMSEALLLEPTFWVSYLLMGLVCK
jgi:hypothetical protein